MAGSRQLGVTPAISQAFPTDDELRLNESLIAELRAQNNFEAAEDTDRRKKVLSRMQKVTEQFVRHVAQQKGLAPSVIESAGGKVSTFGSYRLGAYGPGKLACHHLVVANHPGSDIDTLIITPKHVTRDDFFQHFPSILERMSPDGAIEEMTAVPDAHVPIIKLEYSGISIDLIFTRLAMSSVPENLDLRDSSLLRGLDEADLRSINGTRVTDEILTLVPQQKTFRHALRAVKLWAQRKCLKLIFRC
jgi:poly(A) polymerase